MDAHHVEGEAAPRQRPALLHQLVDVAVGFEVHMLTHKTVTHLIIVVVLLCVVFLIFLHFTVDVPRK